MTDRLIIWRSKNMSLEQLTDLFKWMAIINVGVLVLSTVSIVLLKNVMAKYHSKLFGIKEEHVSLMAYGYLGMYKILIIVFILVPYLSLIIVTEYS